jgi:RNA polymerase sigma-70 factor (ECF subfamily)
MVKVNSDAVDTFESHRGRLFGIAYRMLGSASEAEDIVQDAWLRWQGTDTESVRDPAAFLATVVTRLALTALDSARARREVYVGPWLPEPIDTTSDPLLGAEHAESVSLAVLLLLERLSPAERAAYVLHEAFDYPFRDVAEVLETSEANARQLASRARAHLAKERGAIVSEAERERLLGAILAAARAGDLEGLESMLAEDVVSVSDGGGVVSAARRPIVGRDRVARFIVGAAQKGASAFDLVPSAVNGQTAMLGVRDGNVEGLFTVDVSSSGVTRLLIVLNPQKLERFASPAVSQS